MVYKKETVIEQEVRRYMIRLETMIDFYDMSEDRMEWSVSNLMWLNHNLPKIARGRANLTENVQFIVELLRDRKRLMIP